MKRLNKKGFTLVELLAVVVILAVLMLAGATAIGGVMRSSKGNSLKSSLDAAMKAAETSYALDDLGYAGDTLLSGKGYDEIKTALTTDDNFGTESPKLSNLKDTLSYKDTEYKVAATNYIADGNAFILAAIIPQDGKSFKSVRCGHGKIVEKSDTLTAENLKTDGYYCFDKTTDEDKTGEPAIIILVKKMAE